MKAGKRKAAIVAKSAKGIDYSFSGPIPYIPTLVGAVAAYAWFGFTTSWTSAFWLFIQFVSIMMTVGCAVFIGLQYWNRKAWEEVYRKGTRWYELPDTPITRALLLFTLFAIVWIFTTLSQPPLNVIFAGKITKGVFTLLGVYLVGIGFASILTAALRLFLPASLVNDRRVQRIITALIMAILIVGAGLVKV
ncbi:hypothetical protein HY095_05835 [Candidatus Micrarchaeota archaeon]|nr:hypothetical protein [Candidatus Micrarchaeota archaeon]